MLIFEDKHGMQHVINENLITELKFLRKFYDEAHYYMGPSHGDIYSSIAKDFYKIFKELPHGYYELTAYRVWPDGTTQEAEEGPPYSHKSDDFITIEAFDEEDALFRANINA